MRKILISDEYKIEFYFFQLYDSIADLKTGDFRFLFPKIDNFWSDNDQPI